jgi:hypothetical protein
LMLGVASMDLSAGGAAAGARTSGAARERRLTRRDNRLWLLMTGIQYARCAGARNTILDAIGSPYF